MLSPFTTPAFMKVYAFCAVGSLSIRVPLTCKPSRVSVILQWPIGLEASCCQSTGKLLPALSVR